MNKIIEFFRNKWFFQLLGMIALGLIIWVCIKFNEIKYFDEKEYFIICGLILLWGGINFYLYVRSQQITAEMVADLVDKKNAATSLEEQATEEVAILHARFNEAFQTLKKIGRQSHKNQQSLQELPWYLLIGAPGSGKTTVLLNSGLSFPLANKFGQSRIAGVGGTRHCDWWFTDQAVFLDTAGRYTTQDSQQAVDKAAWLGFLDLLKKYRPRRPINGIFITLSLADLLKQSEEDRQFHAKQIRQRIDELYEYFGIRFPLYMIFTKGDLMAGFSDFFADLTQQEREQVWGFTFPAENQQDTTDVLSRVETEFDLLCSRLQSRLLKRLQAERDPQRRSLMFGFPQRMALIKDNLLSFLQTCFSSNRFQASPHLRGVYLTSATQQGSPIDRLMNVLAQTFQLENSPVSAFQGKGRSYFIQRLLNEVIFPEALSVDTNEKLERFKRRSYYGLIVTCITILITMTGFLANSYFENQQKLSEVTKILEGFPENPPKDFAELLTKINIIESVNNVYSDENLLMHFGLYQGDDVKERAEAIRQEILQKQFLPLIKNSLEIQLKESNSRQDFEEIYTLLEVYLMLGGKETLDKNLLAEIMQREWLKNDPLNPNITIQLATYLKINFYTPQPLDEELITLTQNILNSTPISKYIYTDIKNTAIAEKKELDLGANDNKMFALSSKLTIPSFFTHKSFYEVFLKDLNSNDTKIKKCLRILGQKDQSAIKNLTVKQEILDYYYEDYIQEWEGLLKNLKLAPLNNQEQTVKVLSAAIAEDSPLRKLLQVVDTETKLTQLPANYPLKTAMPNLPLGKKVEKHFQPLRELQINNVISLLKPLFNDMTSTSMATQENADKILFQAENLPEPLKRFVKTLAIRSKGFVAEKEKIKAEEEKIKLNKKWQEEILPEYKNIINKYPFSEDISQKIGLSDFNHFFAQDSVLEKFIQSNQDNPLLSELKIKLNKVKSVFFADNPKSLLVKFDLKPVSLSPQALSFSLTIEGKEMQYLKDNSADLVSIEWAGKVHQIKFEFETATGKTKPISFDGDWALFELLENAKIKPINKQKYRLIFKDNKNNLEAEYELIPSSIDNPFSPDFFKNIQFPESL